MGVRIFSPLGSCEVCPACAHMCVCPSLTSPLGVAGLAGPCIHGALGASAWCISGLAVPPTLSPFLARTLPRLQARVGRPLSPLLSWSPVSGGGVGSWALAPPPPPDQARSCFLGRP